MRKGLLYGTVAAAVVATTACGSQVDVAGEKTEVSVEAEHSSSAEETADDTSNAEIMTEDEDYIAFYEEYEGLDIENDLSGAKDLVARIQTKADEKRSALKDAGESIDEATYSIYRLGANISLEIKDKLSEEEKKEDNNPYGLCCNYVGDCYSDGTGVLQDLDEAKEWYDMAVNTFNCSRAALSYADVLYKMEDYQAAFDAYQAAWDNFSHMKALRMLGKYYEYGLGGLYDIDTEKALEYYKLGADNGDGTSYARWANLYVRQKMGKGKPATFRYTAYEVLDEGIKKLLSLDSLDDHEKVSTAISELKTTGGVDDMFFLMGYVYEEGYENQDGSVVEESNLEEALFWYSTLEGKTHELSYDFDAAVSRVNQKLSGEWVSWDKSYGGVDKMLDEELISTRDELTDSFITDLEYKYADGSFKYNVYLPESYDTSKEYPVVLFLHDGSINEKSAVTAPMMQGVGATIWSNGLSGEDIIVVAPTAYNQDQIIDFMDYIKSEYSIDDKRVYLTGQSQGCIAAYAINADNPDYFTATMYVSGQASSEIPTYEEISDEYADQKWIFVCSEGDTQAYPGIQVIMQKLDDQGADYEITQFSAADSLDVQNANVDELLDKGSDRNIVIFDEGTVQWYNLPMTFADETPTNPEHMYAFDAAYRLESARKWLLSQSK